jgi:hypothetical protein
MITIWVVYQQGKIIAWSSKQMSDQESPIEISEAEYKKLNETGEL